MIRTISSRSISAKPQAAILLIHSRLVLLQLLVPQLLQDPATVPLRKQQLQRVLQAQRRLRRLRLHQDPAARPHGHHPGILLGLPLHRLNMLPVTLLTEVVAGRRVRHISRLSVRQRTLVQPARPAQTALQAQTALPVLPALPVQAVPSVSAATIFPLEGITRKPEQ